MLRDRQDGVNEFAILLEGYLESLEGKITRKDAVRRVSKDLEQMAVNRDCNRRYFSK